MILNEFAENILLLRLLDCGMYVLNFQRESIVLSAIRF